MYTISMKTYIPIYFFMTVSWGQQIIELPKFEISFYDKVDNSIKLYDDTIIYSVNLNTFDITEKKINQFNASKLKFIERLNNKIYLFEDGSGIVYEDNESGIKRIDKSIIENFLDGSIFFKKNDTIFRHGGYGYWTVFNKIIYYDINTNQWELYKNDINGRINHHVFLENNKVYFVGGYLPSKSLPQIKNNNNRVETFSFDTGILKEVGETSVIFLGNIIFSDQQKNIFIDNERKIFDLDFEKNIVREYFSNSLNTKISNRYKVYIIKNKFVFFSERKGNYSLNIFPLDLFISNPVKQYPLFADVYKLKLHFIYVILFLSVIIFFRMFFKKNNINVYPTYVRYKFRKKQISSGQYKVLRLFYLKTEIESKKIDDVIFENDLSRASNYKKKNLILLNLNTSLKDLTNSDNDILLSKKSEFDSRIKVFYFDEKFSLKYKN